MDHQDQQPLVLLGTRSEARGKQIEEALTRDRRVGVLGVHTEADGLMRAFAASPGAVLLLDTALSDASVPTILYRATLQRPTASVVLASAPNGALAAAALRAGAQDCILWNLAPERVRDVTRALYRAAMVGQLPFQVAPVSKRANGNAGASGRFASGRVVVLLGSWRGATLCEATELAGGALPAAIICRDPVHFSMRASLATYLSHHHTMLVSVPAEGAVAEDGTAYVFGNEAKATVEKKGNKGQLRFERAQSFRGDSGARWLQRIDEAIRAEQISTVLIVHGRLAPLEQAFIRGLFGTSVCMASRIPGGYELRWPHLERPLALPPRDFWSHLERHIVSWGLNNTSDESPPIWPAEAEA